MTPDGRKCVFREMMKGMHSAFLQKHTYFKEQTRGGIIVRNNEHDRYRFIDTGMIYE